jgi:exosome complex exonuclease DIS3/RRP44
MNYRHRQAQFAGRASAELFALTYFKNRPTTDAAYVTGVRKNAFSVVLPRLGGGGV